MIRSPRARPAHDWHGGLAWEELWVKLHQQDDVGPASYAAVPERRTRPEQLLCVGGESPGSWQPWRWSAMYRATRSSGLACTRLLGREAEVLDLALDGLRLTRIVSLLKTSSATVALDHQTRMPLSGRSIP